MLVVTLTDCPPALRGDLTKWLLEIDTGVYVGRVSARVRDQIWDRIKNNAKSGRATMVFNTNNEQGMDFRIHNNAWEPIDFDGLKLILRPSPARLVKRQNKITLKNGFSNASKYHMIKKMQGKQRIDKTNNESTDEYIVIDIETTGLSPVKDEIIEIAAVVVINGEVHDTFQTLIKSTQPVPPEIEKLTGITTDMLLQNGKLLKNAMPEFLSFIGNRRIVAHNVIFDIKFLNAACDKCILPKIANQIIDTLKLSRNVLLGLQNYKLSSLLDHFGIISETEHRSLDDCLATHQLYLKLIEKQKS